MVLLRVLCLWPRHQKAKFVFLFRFQGSERQILDSKMDAAEHRCLFAGLRPFALAKIGFVGVFAIFSGASNDVGWIIIKEFKTQEVVRSEGLWRRETRLPRR